MDEELSLDLIKTIQQSDLSELAIDGVDALLESGDLLPVVGPLNKFCRLTTGVSNYLFLKKMLRFLVGLQAIPTEERQRELSRLLVDVNHRKRVGENLILLLDRLNDMQKPGMVAKAWNALVRGRVDLDGLHQLYHAIDGLMMWTIPTLKEFYARSEDQWWKIPDQILHHFLMCGLAKMRGGYIHMDEDRTSFGHSHIGKTFVTELLG